MTRRRTASDDCPACRTAWSELARTRRPASPRSQPPLRVVDLFAGCGGMSLGAQLAARRLRRRVEIPLAADFDEAASAVYLHNFAAAMTGLAKRCFRSPVETLFNGRLGATPTGQEARLTDQVGDVDILVGGPPCQGHSNLNNHTRRNDPRNGFYLRMARAAEILRPTLVVVENVPAVLRDRHGVVGAATSALAAANFDVAHHVVDLLQIGVPQSRRRHILIGVARRAKGAPTPVQLFEGLPQKNQCCRTRTVDWAIRDLLGAEGTTGFDTEATPSPDTRRRIAWLFKNGAFDLADSQRPVCHRNGGHRYKSVYGRLHWRKPAQTLTTGFTCMGQGRNVHPERARTITPHEAARLQGFPDFFDFTAGGQLTKRTVWARLIGNAVPPPLLAEIASRFFDGPKPKLDSAPRLASKQQTCPAG